MSPERRIEMLRKKRIQDQIAIYREMKYEEEKQKLEEKQMKEQFEREKLEEIIKRR